jgi:hypothetical protein
MKNPFSQVVSICLVLLIFQLSYALKTIQPKLGDQIFSEKQGGNFSLGMRNTISFFNDGDPKGIGTGIGGHYRLQITNRVNTEWYADVFTSNIRNLAHRSDYHIGWSVMYYVINPKAFSRKLTPYVLAGHCFDITSIKINGVNGSKGSRFSSEVQCGIGTHYNITPKVDLSFTTQYGFHLGKELDLEESEEGKLSIEKQKNAGWQGHLMISISVNYKIAKIWNRK